jgi:hypothetical protein
MCFLSASSFSQTPLRLRYDVRSVGDWDRVGKHRYRIEGDVFVSINDGPISLTEMQTMMGQVQTAVETRGVRFFLMDLTRAEAPSAEARRWMAQNRYEGIEATAGYGASRTLRVLSDLMRRALDVLHGSSQKRAPFRLFETEAQARAFFDELRKTPKKA